MAEKDTFGFLTELAQELGCTSSALISADKVVVDERVIMKCAVPACHGYGNYLYCPPNTMPVEEFRTVLSRYHTALLIQVESKNNSQDIDKDGLAGKNTAELEAKLHGDANRLLGKIISRLEAEALKAGYYYAAGLSGGLCILCPECVGCGSNEPCRRPFEARPAMEGLGIDVIKTAANAGMSISLSSDEPVRWTGLVLVD